MIQQMVFGKKNSSNEISQTLYMDRKKQTSHIFKLKKYIKAFTSIGGEMVGLLLTSFGN